MTHSSGLAYTFMHPLSIRYQELQGERPLLLQTIVCSWSGISRHNTTLTKLLQRESFDTFLVFEPGEQWLYGPGLEWAGLMVSRRKSGTKPFADQTTIGRACVRTQVRGIHEAEYV